ncbi:hypothetical protein ACO0M4_29200 [Streptomyces sp. RGM 3693]|uniref:hypothetical protein n=1 Tax=Streptomyces sp. RGM 3693 TaxID=3413284 RepID=UPI003D28A649
MTSEPLSAPEGVDREAAGGDAIVRAEEGSIAAGVVNGGVQIGHPSAPYPSQG